MKYIIIPILILSIFFGCSREENEIDLTEDQGRRIFQVSVMVAEEKTINDYIYTVGMTQPDKRLTLKSFNGGLLEKLYYDFNDYVKAGDTVALVDLQLNLIQLNKFLAEFEIVQRDYLNDKRLYERNAIPEINYQRSKNRFEAMQQDLEQIKVYVDRAVIKAPWNGFILEKHAEENELSSPMQPIYTMAKMDKLKVYYELPERFINYFKENTTKVEITFDAYPDIKIESIINNISRDINYQNMTYNAETIINNQNYRIRSGQLARVKILKQEITNSISIPSNAVLDFEDGSKIYVVENNKAVLRDVTTGVREQDCIQITSGLEVGETVIIDGQHILFHGDSVEVVETK